MISFIQSAKNKITVKALLSDPLLSKFSIIQAQTHSPNSIYAYYFSPFIIQPISQSHC